MELKIETVLFVAIVSIIGGSLTVKLNKNATTNKPFTKELEFTKTTFTEVNTLKMQGRAYGTYGVLENGVLSFDNFVYYSETIRSLLSRKGRYVENTFYLDGNVTMEDTQGYTYKTEHAHYNQKSEILYITDPYVIRKALHVIQGDTLEYDTRNKVLYGKTINAEIYTADK